MKTRPPGLARRMAVLKPSAIREILKATSAPGVLSLAGGLPAPELFPVAELAEAHAKVFAEAGPSALQYSTSEGFGPLREWVVARLQKQGVATAEVLITNGSQQGIDLAARALLDEGDAVAVENPSYLAALNVFHGAGARLVTVRSDEHGLDVEHLEARCRSQALRAIYVVPDFHNPTGRTLSMARRLALVRLARERSIPIIEDSPYHELRFSGPALPSLAALADGATVIHLGTFSKTLAPGPRIGWCAAPQLVLRAMTVVKQSCDLHTSSLSQRALATLLTDFDYDHHVTVVRAAYRERARQLRQALLRELPGFEAELPQGGLFLWGRLGVGPDADALFAPALRQQVAYVPGRAFYVRQADPRRLRLNFSHCPPALLDEAASRLGRAHREFREGAQAAAGVTQPGVNG